MSKILIDRLSIKPNPDAGQTTFHMRGPIKVSFTCEGPLPECMKCDAVYINEFGFEATAYSEAKGYFGGVILDPVWFKDHAFEIKKAAKKSGALITVNYDQRVETYNSFIPQPDWNYKHVDARVACDSCGHDFNLSEAYEVDFDGGGDGWYCPMCGDEIDLRYEEIGDVLKELGIKK